MALKDFLKDFARWFSSPLSGTKRRRDESNLNDHNEARQAPAVRAGQTSNANMDELKPSQRNGEPPAAGPAPSSLQDPAASNWQLTTEDPQKFTFDLADRVRELAPTRGAKTPQASAGRFLQQKLLVRDFDNPNSGAPQALLTGQRLGTVGLHPPPRPPLRGQELHQQQRHQQPDARAVIPPSAQFERYVTSHGAPTCNVGISGYQGTTPRQLFATPDATRRDFDKLRLGGDTPAARGGVVAASTATEGLGGASIGGGNSYYGAPAGGSTANGLACAAGPSSHASIGYRRPLSYMTPTRGQPVAPYQYQQRQQPQAVVPFHVSFTAHMGELGGVAKTQEDLKAMVKAFEARNLRREPVIRLREDGGFIPGDDDEETAKTSALTQDVRATVERLRTTLAATVRKVANDPRVTAAAGSRKAAQTALEATQAAAGAHTLAAIGLKMAAQEQALKQIHTQMEEETRRKLDALQAEQAVRREQQQQQHQRIREGFMLLQQQVLGREGRYKTAATAGSVPVALAASAAAARRDPRPAHGRGRASVSGVNLPPPPGDDVVDLLSSDDEAEEEEEEDADDVAEKDGQEDEEELDNGDPYGVEYGAYPGEHRGRGNPALAVATRAERSTWRRTMDADADPGELMVDFRPNAVLVIELSRAKLQCMNLNVWLNDEVINLYMLLLQMRDTRFRQTARTNSSPAPRCHFFNSFFYNKLFQDEGAYNYANVRRWTIPRQLINKMQPSSNVLELDRIIIPIHKGVHWTCAEIDLKARAVRYYDSLMGEDHALVRHLLTWVSDESADKCHQRWDTSKWSVEFPKDIPVQRNGCDCGVFSIMFADRRGAGLPFDFSQRDMGLLRIKVLHRVVQMRVD
ncbi:hypothetical protein VaNZ11_013954 [Volvox africanus]|uniref:Ubiquitin-like protease family profile domain-containing protein n=1 Tax=Volvox africanus TaxID=51714 RepID=A0ABQ5SHE8_9CHLO|nr:hypothetical protein VaNZ11_013954 [Volvox africanus]